MSGESTLAQAGVSCERASVLANEPELVPVSITNRELARAIRRIEEWLDHLARSRHACHQASTSQTRSCIAPPPARDQSLDRELG